MGIPFKLLPLVMVGLGWGQTPTPAQVPPSGPTISWVGCGPSLSGKQEGVSCGFEAPVVASQGLFLRTVEDFTFYKGKPISTLSSGAVLDVRKYRIKNGTLHFNLLGAPGVTQTGGATVGSFTWGVHPAFVWNDGFTVGVGYRGATGVATPKLWNVSVGWSFK